MTDARGQFGVGELAHLTRVVSPDQRDRVLSWAEVDRQVDAVAAGLRGLGLATGDRVAVQLGNTPDFPVVYFGALRLILTSDTVGGPKKR